MGLHAFAHIERVLLATVVADDLPIDGVAELLVHADRQAVRLAHEEVDEVPRGRGRGRGRGRARARARVRVRVRVRVRARVSTPEHSPSRAPAYP